jgi:Mn2+/Fe2+ NRAMP family transporter
VSLGRRSAGIRAGVPAGITTYSILGSKYGYELLWVLALSTVALIVFHLLGARMGVVTRKGLMALVRDSFAEARLFYTVYGVVLVIAAAIVLISGAPLVKILYLTQALNAVLLLAILPFMRRLALDPAVMGEQTLSTRGRWVTAGALAMIAASVGALFVLTAF